MSRLGSRSKRIEIQRYTTVVGTAGTRTRTWLKLADAWANVQEKYGSEPLKSGTDYPILRVHFTIRDVSGILPEYRVLYEGRYHEIIEVKEVTYQRNRYLELITEKRGNQEGTATSLPTCLDGTFENSDGTYSVAVPSGETVTGDDISVTEVDGTTKDVPSNKDITCLWKTLQLESSDGVDIFLDGQVNNDVLTYPGGGAIAVSDLNVRDSDGFNTSYPRRSRLVISGAAIQGVAQDAVSTTITVPTAPAQSGILYQQIMPQHFRTSYNVGDTAWHWQNGTYNRTPPSYPEAVAEIDYTAVQSDVRAIPAPGTTANDSVSPTMLKENNAFGNKYRFTDSAGNPSDSTANSLFAHTDWLNHSFSGAIQDYIIDHLFGLGQITRYIQDGSKTSLAVNDPDGQSIDDWIAYVHTANLKGLSGWRLPDLTTSMASILGANFFPNSSEWAGNTFFSERTDNRFSAALCEALASNFYLQMNDSNGSQFPVYRVQRTQDLGFASDICHVFPVRNHY